MKQIKNIYAVCEEIMKHAHIIGEEVSIQSVTTLVHIFENGVHDFRVLGRCKFKLHNLITIAFFSILCGFTNASEIAVFTKRKSQLLKVLGLIEDDCYPSHDTFRRILSLVDINELQETTYNSLKIFFDKIEKHFDVEGRYYQYGIDGKENRGSGRSKETLTPLKNIAMLNVYDISRGIVLECQNIDSKTNEIPVAQEILKAIKLKNVIITCDALHTQIDTAKQIAAKGGHYVFTVKDNQKTLLEDISNLINVNITKIQKNPKRYFTEEVKSSNIIKKEFFLYPIANKAFGDDWVNSKSCVLYRKHIKDKKTGIIQQDDLYFISSLSNFEVIVEAIKNRWQIENRLHRYKDLLLEEDGLRYINKTLQNNLSILNNMALTLLKLTKPIIEAPTYKSTRKIFQMEGERLLKEVLAVIDSEKLLKKIKKEMISK